jgi:hypothetical protein
MNVLPSAAHIRQALPRVAVGLEKYCWLQEELLRRDVSLDPEYRRRFIGFYRVRRRTDWLRVFFDTLQARKTNGISFQEALEVLASETGRIEASFASKLVATIDPDQPVIDSIVLRNVGLRLPARTAKTRMADIVALHRQLGQWYKEQLSSEVGAAAVRAFRTAYPNAQITDTKLLDLVLWQIRKAV